jgi:hypothetical protein
MDFDLTVRYLYGKPQSDFDALLEHLEELIDTFERNAKATTVLYAESYLAEKEKVKKEFAAIWEAAHEIYKEGYDEMSGDESQRDAWASHKANYGQIEGEEQTVEENIDRNHREMIDHYNKSATAMLYSILEGQFRRFSELLRLMGNHKLSVEDLQQRDYIEGIYKYLQLVIGLDTTSILSFKDNAQQCRISGH